VEKKFASVLFLFSFHTLVNSYLRELIAMVVIVYKKYK
jgi:hypothetical protein